MLLHFNDLKADLPGEVRRIAAFLGVALTDAQLADVVRESHIDRMREVALQEQDLLAAFFDGGAKRFFFKGTNGRWRDVLDADDPRALRGSEAARTDARVRDCWSAASAADRHRGR
jgi:aryl sulfotransferase